MGKYTLILIGLLSTTLLGDLTNKDLTTLTKFSEGEGIYTVVQPNTPFKHTNDCDGAFYPQQKAIFVLCGRGTKVDRAISVLLHEIGHSQQYGVFSGILKQTPEDIYNKEVEAWDNGEKLAKLLGMWNDLDTFSWSIMKEIGLHSYRRNFKPTWNFMK